MSSIDRWKYYVGDSEPSTSSFIRPRQRDLGLIYNLKNTPSETNHICSGHWDYRRILDRYAWYVTGSPGI